MQSHILHSRISQSSGVGNCSHMAAEARGRIQAHLDGCSKKALICEENLGKSSKIRKNLHIATQLAKRCLDLNFIPESVQRLQQIKQDCKTDRHKAMQKPRSSASQVYNHIESKTLQLQQQNNNIVAVLDQQSAKLTAQQSLIQDLVQGMLYVATRCSTTAKKNNELSGPYPNQSAKDDDCKPHMNPSDAKHAAVRTQSSACEKEAVFQDLINILSQQPAHPAFHQRKLPALNSSVPEAELRNGIDQFQATSHSLTPHFSRAASKCMSGRGDHPSCPAPAQRDRTQKETVGRHPSGSKTKPDWDDRFSISQPVKFFKMSSMNDPTERVRQPRGASASLAAQLLQQKIQKYGLQQYRTCKLQQGRLHIRAMKPSSRMPEPGAIVEENPIHAAAPSNKFQRGHTPNIDYAREPTLAVVQDGLQSMQNNQSVACQELGSRRAPWRATALASHGALCAASTRCGVVQDKVVPEMVSALRPVQAVAGSAQSRDVAKTTTCKVNKACAPVHPPAGGNKGLGEQSTSPTVLVSEVAVEGAAAGAVPGKPGATIEPAGPLLATWRSCMWHGVGHGMATPEDLEYACEAAVEALLLGEFAFAQS